MFKQVQQIAKKYKFSLDKPVSQLSKNAINVLLYGKEDIPISGNGEDNTNLMSVNMDTTEEISFVEGDYEGIVNMIRRWFSSGTTSDALRTWVEKFMQLKTCISCNGKRLKKESLWFKIDE